MTTQRQIFLATAVSSLALWGCAPEESQKTASEHPFALPGGGWQVPASGADPSTLPPPIQITMDGPSVAGSVSPTVIDSRSWDPQILDRGFYAGELRRPAKLLPKHSRDKTLKKTAPNDLTPGTINHRQRVQRDVFFPAVDQSPWRPPDPSIAPGRNHVVTVVNMELAWFRKDGTKEFQQRLDSSGDPGFFEEVGSGTFTFDPKCFYDPYVDRFVVLALEVYQDTSESWMTIAVSDDGDPNGTWYKYRTWSVLESEGAEFWNDYPGFGFDERAWYITANMYGFGNGTNGTLLRMIDKAGAIDGTTVTYNDLSVGNFSWQIGHALDAADQTYLVRRGGSTELHIGEISDPLGSASFSSEPVAVPEFNIRQDAPTAVGPGLWVIDGRMLNVFVRDQKLWTCHAIQPAGENEVMARWYEVDLEPNVPELLQSGQIDLGEGEFTYFPAVAVNSIGEVGMVYGHSSSSTNPTLEAVGRIPSDPLGTMSFPTILQESSTSPNDGGNLQRWGDYFDCTVDPVNQRTFWMTGEIQTDDGWQTQIVAFNVSVPADLNGDGKVDGADLGLLLIDFGSNGPGDLNADGLIDGGDLGLMLTEWR